MAIIMVWLYFCIVCLMIGAEINVYYHDNIRKIYHMIKPGRKRSK